MNLFEVQERLKDFSKSQLVNEMQRPSGMAPQYLVLSELQRRGRMEKAFAAEQAKQGSQSTVAQDAVNAAGMPQGGLAQMAQAMAPRTDMNQNTGVAPVQGMAEGGEVRRMQPGGLAGINRNVAAFMPMRRGARGNQFMSLTPDEVGGTIAVNALVADPRIREAAARSELSPEDYISRLNAEQFSSALALLDQPIEGPTVRDEPSFALEGQPTPELSPARLSESGLTGVDPIPVVSSEDIMAEANRPENRRSLTDQEIVEVAGAPFVAEMEALADPELEGITEEAARRLGDLYVRGVERAAETPLGLPSLEDTIAATRTTSSAITGALADQLGFGPEPTLSGDFLADFQNYGMDAVNREGATVTEGPNDLEIRRALANDPSLTQAERDAYAAQAAALEYLYNAGQTADDAIADAYALTGRVAGAGLEGLGRGVSFFSPEAGAPLISFGRDVSTSMDPIAEQGFFPGVSGDQAVDSTGAETPSMVPVPRPDNLVPPSEAPVPIAGGGSGGSGGTGGGGRGRGTDGDRMLEQDKWLALAQFGLGLMGSQAPTIGQAIGESGIAALGQLQKARTAAVERDLAERTLAARSAVRPDRLSLSDRLRFITDQMETIRAQIALEPEPGRKMDLADELASLQQQAAAIMGTEGPNTARLAADDVRG